MGKQRDGVGLGEEGGRGNLARMKNKLIDFFKEYGMSLKDKKYVLRNIMLCHLDYTFGLLLATVQTLFTPQRTGNTKQTS